MNGKRGDRNRPDDSLFVMILFDRGGGCPAHANPVTPHDHWIFFPIEVEEMGFHRFAVFGPQNEDMAHFDAALDQIGSR